MRMTKLLVIVIVIIDRAIVFTFSTYNHFIYCIRFANYCVIDGKVYAVAYLDLIAWGE